MKKVHITIATCILLSSALFAQTATTVKPSGTVNGKPIPQEIFNWPRERAVDSFILKNGREPSSPADEQAVDAIAHQQQCDRLKAFIEQTTRDSVAQQLGIVVTQTDIQAAREWLTREDPAIQAARIHQTGAAVLGALAAVFDQHRDPDQVYSQMLAPIGLPKNLWKAYLHDAATPDGRANLTKLYTPQLMTTAETLKKSMESSDILIRLATKNKLDEAVDEQIAAGDPTFRNYLQEQSARSQNLNPKQQWMPASHFAYLKQKRAEFWKAQISKVQVFLSDPSIAKSCGLGAMGIHVSGEQ